ncbi:MAG: MFS transporter [Actinobacteria bacterium]|nr:MFS transporter [Actinomycetota bacterium]
MTESHSAPPSGPFTAAPDPLRWKTLLVVGIAALMVVLDSTVINIALPSIQQELNLTDAERQWVITAYSLTFGGLLLLGGRISDFAGRKRCLIIGLIGFAVASAIAGLSTTGTQLILARAATGVFAALLAPTTLALIAVTFLDVSERTKAFAVYSAISAAGGAVGLVLGGVLTEYVNWNWCLLINVPIAVVAALLAIPFVRENRVVKAGGYDLPGALLGTLGLVCLVFGVSEASVSGWSNSLTVGMLMLSVVLLAAFFLVEWKSAHPLLPLRILTERNRGGAYLAGLFSGAALFATFLFISYYLQEVLLFSPLQAGLAGIPFSVGVVVSTYAANALLPRLGPRNVATIGFFLATLGTVGLARLSPESSYVVNVLPPLVIMSLGMGLIFVPLTASAVYRVAPSDTGVASALVSVTQQIGGAIGVALLNTVASATTAGVVASTGQSAASAQSLVAGYTAAFAWSAGILVIGGLLWFALVRVKLADLAAQASASG